MNGDSTESLIQKYANKGIFVDTNLLLLLLVGLTDPQLVPKFPRTEQFVPEDFDTLNIFLSKFKLRLTLPNVLTEVSNLAGKIDGKAKKIFDEKFRKFIETIDETYVPSGDLIEDDRFSRFGLTDCAIMTLVKKRYLLLTDDFRLSKYFLSIGGDVINFNHIRIWAQAE